MLPELCNVTVISCKRYYKLLSNFAYIKYKYYEKYKLKEYAAMFSTGWILINHSIL